MMAKKSKFGSAFAEARKSGKKEFDFGGKKFNTKLKKEGKKSSSKLPKTTSVMPSSRSANIDKSNARPSFSGMSDVASNAGKKKAMEKSASKPVVKSERAKLVPRTEQSGANMRSRAYIANHKEKPAGPGFLDKMKKMAKGAAGGFKKQTY